MSKDDSRVRAIFVILLLALIGGLLAYRVTRDHEA
jgi:hypothetical protein